MSAFPGLDHIFELADPMIERPFRADCSLADLNMMSLTGLGLLPPPGRSVRLYHGSGGAIPSDIVWSRGGGQPLVSDNILALLRDHHVTGWDTFPVEILDKHGDLHTSYHRLMVTGRCGRIDWTRGERFERSEVPFGWHYRGGWFDPDSWDGSDMFTDGYCGETWVVERVQQLFDRAKIRNIMWNRIVDIEIAERHALSRARMELPLS